MPLPFGNNLTTSLRVLSGSSRQIQNIMEMLVLLSGLNLSSIFFVVQGCSPSNEHSRNPMHIRSSWKGRYMW